MVDDGGWRRWTGTLPILIHQFNCHMMRCFLACLQTARADNVAALRALPGVTVVLRDAELKRRHENSRHGALAGWLRVLLETGLDKLRFKLWRRVTNKCPSALPLFRRIWKESWLSAFFHKPCNHELFVMQSLNMEGAWPVPLPCWDDRTLPPCSLHLALQLMASSACACLLMLAFRHSY